MLTHIELHFNDKRLWTYEDLDLEQIKIEIGKEINSIMNKIVKHTNIKLFVNKKKKNLGSHNN